MRAHILHWASRVAVIGCLAVVANAATIATFSDPAADESTSLFDADMTSYILKGAWDGTTAPPALQLVLKVPFTGQEYIDASFETSDLAIDPNSPTTIGGGTVTFRDSGGQTVLTITFSSAILFGGFGFGASDLVSNQVVFSGPGIPANLTQNQFSFSFANPVATATGYNYTASFTSSAVPEPAALSLVVLAACVLLRQRR